VVDDDRQILVDLLVRDLVDPDPPQPGRGRCRSQGAASP
jgi:hypothetical protein